MNARIEVLTPVHIGSGEMRIRDVDFVIQDNKLVMLDHTRMMGGLGHESISDWAVDVAHGKPLKDLLQRFAPGKTALDFQAAAYPLFYKDKNVGQLKTAVRSMDRPYIPGSSLKGAIRTMLLAQLVKNLSPEKPDSYAFENSKGIYSFKDVSFQKRVFGDDPNNDLLRFFHVSDAMFGSDSIEVREAHILNHSYRDGWHHKKGLAMLYECISAGKTAECRINWAENAFKLGLSNKRYTNQSWQPKGLLDVLQRSHQHTGEILSKEINNWETQIKETEEDTEIAQDYLDILNVMFAIYNKCVSNKEFIFRVGSHSGWNFTTGSWIFRRIPEGTHGDAVYDGLSEKVQKKHYGNKYAVFPKTRKVLSDDLLPGFIKLVLI